MEIDWAIIAAMILLNGVFAAYEIALASISLSRLEMLAAEQRWGAKAAFRMKASMEASLAVVQLGITLVGVIAAATGGAEAQEGIAPFLQNYVSARWAEFLALAIVVVPLTIITIVIGELIPKVFALRNKELVCLRLSPAMLWFSFVVWPAVWMLEAVVKGSVALGERFLFRAGSKISRDEASHLQELRATAAVARSSRLIGPRQERIILSAARLSSRPVGEIVLPAEHVSLFNIDDSLSDCLIAAHLDMHTRFPVTERHGDPQGIIGYVNFKDLVSQMRLAPKRPKLASILRPLPVFGASVPIAHVLESMMREHTHIALVRDAEQRVLGIVTLEDIIEELVGEIEDEHDRLPTHVASSEAGWIVGGGVTLARLREVTGIDLEGDKPQEARLLSRTLAQWMEEELGRTVKGGDELQRAGLRILVRKIRRQEVQEAQLSRIE
jgi:putative hemolysin